MLYKIPWFVRQAMADYFRSELEDMPSAMEEINHPKLYRCFYYDGCIVVPGPLDILDPEDSWSLITEEFNRERHTVIQQSGEASYSIYRSDCVAKKECSCVNQRDQVLRLEKDDQESAQADL